MAYVSDIDLATLHKKRLDEKNHYKLSWFGQSYDDGMSHQQQKNGEHKVKSKVVAKSAKASTGAKVSSKPAPALNEVRRVDKAPPSRNRSPDFYDEGYLSSPTMSRRRSGTWP